MHDKKSIYSLNKKDPDAIVYRDANRQITRLTREDFDTEADFLKWKCWSDENYHEEEKENHVHADHTLPLDYAASDTGSTTSPEIIIEQHLEESEREFYAAETVIRIKGELTEKQFRRLWMYCVNGMTEQEIAAYESVGQQRISKSITSAIKRLKKFSHG